MLQALVVMAMCAQRVPMDSDRFVELMSRLPTAALEHGGEGLLSSNAFIEIDEALRDQTLTQAQFDTLAYLALPIIEDETAPSATRTILMWHLWSFAFDETSGLAAHLESIVDSTGSLSGLAARDPTIVARIAPLLEHEHYGKRIGAAMLIAACGEAGRAYWPALLRLRGPPCAFCSGNDLFNVFMYCGEACVPFLMDQLDGVRAHKAAHVLSTLSPHREEAAAALRELAWEEELAPYRARALAQMLFEEERPQGDAFEAELIDGVQFGGEFSDYLVSAIGARIPKGDVPFVERVHAALNARGEDRAAGQLARAMESWEY